MVRSFYSGLTKKSLWIILAGFTQLAACLILLEGLVRSGAFTLLPESFWLLSPHDDATHLAYLSHTLKKRTRSNRIYFIGGCVARESIESVEWLTTKLSTHLRRKVEVINYTAKGGSIAQFMGLVDHIPPGEVTLIFALNPNLFAFRPERFRAQGWGQKLQLYSSTLHKFLRDEPASRFRLPTLLPGILNYSKNFAAMWAKRLRTGGARYEHLRHFPISLLFEPQRAAIPIYEDSHPKTADFDEFFHYNLRALERLVGVARQRGFGVLFVESPMHPKGKHIHKPIIARYRPAIQNLADRMEIAYGQYADQIKLLPIDFNRYYLNETARERHQKALFRYLSRTLPMAVREARPANFPQDSNTEDHANPYS